MKEGKRNADSESDFRYADIISYKLPYLMLAYVLMCETRLCCRWKFVC